MANRWRSAIPFVDITSGSKSTAFRRRVSAKSAAWEGARPQIPLITGRGGGTKRCTPTAKHPGQVEVLKHHAQVGHHR